MHYIIKFLKLWPVSTFRNNQSKCLVSITTCVMFQQWDWNNTKQTEKNRKGSDCKRKRLAWGTKPFFLFVCTSLDCFFFVAWFLSHFHSPPPSPHPSTHPTPPFPIIAHDRCVLLLNVELLHNSVICITSSSMNF